MTYQAKPYGNILACVFDDDYADATFHETEEQAKSEADRLNASSPVVGVLIA